MAMAWGPQMSLPESDVGERLGGASCVAGAGLLQITACPSWALRLCQG